MPRPTPAGGPPTRGRRLKLSAVLAIAAISGSSIAALTGLASAKTTTTLGIGHSIHVVAKVENIAVNSKSLTVYTLSGETTRRFKCTKANGCMSFWFPVKVASKKTKLTAASGIKGKLSTVSRGSFLQLTLGGHPLYTFKLDNNTPRKAVGEGIPSFGGVWHVVTVGTTKHTSTTSTSTTTTSPYLY